MLRFICFPGSFDTSYTDVAKGHLVRVSALGDASGMLLPPLAQRCFDSNRSTSCLVVAWSVQKVLAAGYRGHRRRRLYARNSHCDELTSFFTCVLWGLCEPFLIIRWHQTMLIHRTEISLRAKLCQASKQQPNNQTYAQGKTMQCAKLRP